MFNCPIQLFKHFLWDWSKWCASMEHFHLFTIVWISSICLVCPSLYIELGLLAKYDVLLLELLFCLLKTLLWKHFLCYAISTILFLFERTNDILWNNRFQVKLFIFLSDILLYFGRNFWHIRNDLHMEYLMDFKCRGRHLWTTSPRHR